MNVRKRFFQSFVTLTAAHTSSWFNTPLN